MGLIDDDVTRVAKRAFTPPHKARKRKPVAAPASVFGPVGRATAPLDQARVAARQKVVRAQQRAPARAVPAIPTIDRPTHRQVQAAQGLAAGYQRRQVRAAGGGAGAVRAVRSELAATHPEYVQTTRHYQRAASLDALETLGRSALRGRKLSRGQAIRVGQQVARAYQRDTVRKGRPDERVGLPGASINLTAAARTLNALPGLSSGDLGPREIVRNTIGDVGTIAQAPFVGGLQIAGAGVGLATGDTKPGERLAKGVWKSIKESSPAALVGGDVGLAGRRLRAHPLLEALNYAGAEAIAGRAAGAVARGVGSNVAGKGARGALARAGDRYRPPVATSLDPAEVKAGAYKQRRYSGDLGRKQAQKATDTARFEVLKDARGRPVQIEDQGRRTHVLVPASDRRRAAILERQQAGRTDFRSARGNALAQAERQVVEKSLRSATRAAGPVGRVGRKEIRGRAARDLVALVATGTVRSEGTFKQDLLGRAAMIEAAVARHEKHGGVFADSGELRTARENVRMLRSAAGSEKVLGQAPRIVAQGKELARQLNALDERQRKVGIGDAGQLRRARLSEYALAHMGARNVTVEQHAALERAARADERAAQRAWQAAPDGEKAAARSAYVAAREHRIAVSGKHPVEVRARERAQVEVRSAEVAHEAARKKVDRLRKSRDRTVGAQASRRGSRAMRGEQRHATPEERRKLAQKDKLLKEARAERKQTGRALADAQKALKSTRRPQAQEAIRTAEGKQLPDEAILAHAAQHGRTGEDIAHLPHTGRSLGGRAFYKQLRPGSRPTLGKRRTGELYVRGATKSGHELVREELTNRATRVTKAEQLDAWIHEAGVRAPDGRMFTRQQGAEMARRLETDTGQRYVPVSAFSAATSPEVRRVIEQQQAQGATPDVVRGMESLHRDLLNDNVLRDKQYAAGGARNVVLMPAAEVEQMLKHLAPAGEIQKAVQLLNSAFRRAVLPQPRWLTGNFIEPFFVRLPMAGGGVVNIPGLANDIRIATRYVKQMERSGDPAIARAGREIRAQQFGGLFVGRRGASVRRAHEDFTGRASTALYVAHVVRHLPVVKQLADMVVGLTNGMFHINRVLESTAQRAALGKSLRGDIQTFTGSWLKSVRATDQVLKELQAGGVKTATQQRWMKTQHELLGQYEGFPPWMRKAVQTGVPFIPWALNSLRFVFVTLPVHHTAKEAALLNAWSSVAQEWQDAHAGVPPGSLQLASITGKGGLVDKARYTPFGLTGEIGQGQYQALTDFFLPQASGAVAALSGKDPFGRDLQVPKTAGNPKGAATSGQRLLAALNALGEATVPGVAQARRVLEGGATGYGTSTVFRPQTKPGTKHMSGLRRAFDPFRPTYLKDPVSPIVAGRRGGAGSVDLDEVRSAIREQAAALDSSDLEEIRALIRGAGR